MTNLLAIDAGNTRIKWGVHDSREWIARGMIDTAQAPQLKSALSNAKIFNIINTIQISNVAGEAVAETLSHQLDAINAEKNFVRAKAMQCGVINRYESPTQLGADRWCALIAAHHVHKGDAIVVMAGTAMTVDALTQEGEFLGGVIVPGLALMQDSLRARTAQLRPETGVFKPFPTNTQDAIHGGMIQASIGAIMQMRAAMQQAGHANPVCIISGGGAVWLVPHLDQPVVRVENLVLEGLLQIGRS